MESNAIYGRIPPQAIDIESAVLGNVMLFPESADKASTMLSAEMFYNEANQIIYKAIIESYRSGHGCDMLTVTNQLRKTGDLETVGGAYYLSKLTDNCYGNFESWCLILKQKYTRRTAIQMGHELMQAGYDDSIDELESYDKLDAIHRNLSDLIFGTRQLMTFTAIAGQSLAELTTRIERYQSGELPGLSTGLKELNLLTGGWSNGDLIIVAGRPGMGKTAVALHFAVTTALQGKHVYMFSLEMTNTRLADRIIVGQTDSDNYRYKVGKFEQMEIDRVTQWVKYDSNLNIHFDEKSFVTVDYIITNARLKARKKQCDMVVVDYLQLVNMTIERGGTKDAAIGVVTGKLKSLAKELNIPVILLSQLNRKVEDRTDKRPQLADLRESGNIEQDADIVMFTYRPAYYEIEQYRDQPTKGLMILDIAKHRNGASNIDVMAQHNESLTRFTDWNEMSF